MLAIQSLRFAHFKNYAQGAVSLCPQVNCFTGKNGAGKTNILDAVYYLSFTKSFLNGSDQQHIQQNSTDYFFIEASFLRNELEEHVRIAVQRGAKKSVQVNNNEHKKLSDHIGLYPLVMIAPNDIMLIHESSEERRKFMDGFIAQFDKIYLADLLAYNRVLEQRNKQLKLFAEQQYMDATLLQTYNEQLIRYGTSIYLKRTAFMEQFIPVFRSFYATISNANETVDLTYETDLHTKSMNELLQATEQNDLAAQRTTKGIHKDELVFTLNNQPLKKFGSQGQQKSFIISLKLAQYDYLKQKTMTKPLLLLDDIFEKLDEHRLNTLLSMIAHGDFGQLFITDTHLQRLQEVFQQMPQVMVKYFVVDNGSINEI
ncbi:MAG: DNA replication and repair protein RecF [Bacteroidota bacterium]